MHEPTTIAWIGAGNMAEALIRAALRAGRAPDSMRVSDVRPERLEWCRRHLGVATAPDNAAAARGAELVVLAVKPQQLRAALDSLRGAIDTAATVLSIAAGVPTARIETLLGGRPRVVRAMPNTPALVGAGAAAVCAGRYADELDLARAESALRPAGIVERVPEELMDAVTAISGSGPAYVFLLIELMLNAGVRFGLPTEVARRLVLATVAGAARLLESTGLDAREARRRVTSEKGTTDAAIRELERRDVPAAWAAALDAARRRAAELAAEA
ncbi:MAG: pyrroline-5-carboxylate reductase [Kiritimatiellae bacterium]|nr:pyrroline-5-carboxylate reductase [Kiritimatiellia bacterium]